MIELHDVYADMKHTNAIVRLYGWLEQRTPEQSISHRNMPTMKQHAAFVLRRPYLAWYLIKVDEGYAGNIYLTALREVGIYIDETYRGRGIGSIALERLRDIYPGPILANINPKNEPSIAFFKRHGARLIQHTYTL
jgi:RimJ/RimL family protein N-acetyltransferase